MSKKLGMYILLIGLVIYLLGAFMFNNVNIVIAGWCVGLLGVIINLVIFYKNIKKYLKR